MEAGQINNRQGQPARTARGSPGEFFIPDLCNVQALLFLVLVAELLAIVLELAANGIALFDWQSFSLTSLFVQWVFLLSAVLLCQLRQRLSHWPVRAAATSCYLLILLVVAVASLLGQWLLRGGINGQGSTDYHALLTHIAICAVLAGIALRYLFLTQQLQLRQQAELQARIQALQSRIRPHFLFNSMNIIASLIPVDQEAAETAVEDLAGLFRASLAEVETQVTVAEELELCRRYVRIEQLRLEDRLQVEWRVEGLPPGLKIPTLSIQPLLENAIYHGIQGLPEGGLVTIEAQYQAGQFSVTVSNPMLNSADSSTAGNQLALDNINLRLQALYGPKAGLSTERGAQQFRAHIRYPQRLTDHQQG